MKQKKDRVFREVLSMVFVSGAMLTFFSHMVWNHLLRITLTGVITKAVLSGLYAGKKARKITLLAIGAAIAVSLAAGLDYIGIGREILSGFQKGNLGPDSKHLMTIYLFVLTALAEDIRRLEGSCVAYVFVTAPLMLLMLLLGCEWNLKYSFLLLISIGGFMITDRSRPEHEWKTWICPIMIAALLSCILIPKGGISYKPLRDTADEVTKTIIAFFNLDKDDLEQRQSYNIRSYGWQDHVSQPTTAPVMQVYANETLYLRASIRYKYDIQQGWVDESNDEKAGRIKRYMLTGLEGRLYRDEYERTFDLEKARSCFTVKTANVQMLQDENYWSIYCPNRTTEITYDGDARLYYNNIGEVFASRRLMKGDAYSFKYLSLSKSAEEAIAGVKGKKDPSYSFVMELNRGIPAGISQELYDLVYRLIADCETPYETARTLCDYLRLKGTYSLIASRSPAGTDPASWFVLNDTTGCCRHYAAAMTLMARMAGLPARYVEGFVAEPDETGMCVVTGENAHAWCEVYFEGYGWMTFEATPEAWDGDDEESGSESGTTQNDPPKADDDFDAPDDPEENDTPEPKDTPSPEQTPESSNEPETEDPSEEDPDTQDDDRPENDETNENDTQDERSEAQTNEERSAGSILRVVICLLILLVLIYLIYKRMRKREKDILPWEKLQGSRPEYAEKRCRSDKEKLILWYKACMVALRSNGFDYEPGETLKEYARRAVKEGKADEAFVYLTDIAADSIYSDKAVGSRKKAVRAAYEGIKSKLSFGGRLKWYAFRVKNSLGNTEQLP